MNHREEPAPKVLYIVGTPIGNLGDLSPRAKSVLKNISIVACEDTRHSGKLLKTLKSTASIISFHRHNTQSRIPKLLSLLNEGKSVALISDAGMPGISDPGEELIKKTKEAGLEVICIPGPCAAIIALVSSGLPTERFCFEGFLPLKTKERKIRLSSILNESRTTIIYESPHRLIKLLKELHILCGSERPLQVARELTKLHEQLIGNNIGEVINYFTMKKPQGELTLVLGGASQDKQSKQISAKELLTKMDFHTKEGLSPGEAAKKVSEESGYSRKLIYELRIKNKYKKE